MGKRLLCLFVLLLGITAAPIAAQTNDPAPLQIFRVRSTDGNTAGQDTITFFNLLTGETASADVYGSRYTIAGSDLLYFDRLNNQIGLISPNGTVRPHPFIEPATNTRRVDWAVSADNRLIAWTLTVGEPEAMTTTTFVANMDGSERRQVLVDGPRNGIRATPVAFSSDDTTLYMDYQPEALGDFTPYSEYAGLFEVSLKEGGVVDYLPNEPGCFCGAGFGGGFFVRLALAEDLSGFDLLVTDLAADTTTRIDAVDLDNYTQGGDVLVSPDGTRAIYALAQVQNFGTQNQTVRTVFVLTDLRTFTQRPLTSPLFNYIRPVAWTESNSSVIFISPDTNATWKINLETGRLEEIARATYIGTLTPYDPGGS
jgi:hypothetical protein